MIDTRPLWERALSTRGVVVRNQRLTWFLQVTGHLSNQGFVDALRVALGKDALRKDALRVSRLRRGAGKEQIGSYRSLEWLRRRADPQCGRCGGSGYYDAEYLDMRCKCTGLPQHAPPQPRRTHVSDPSFAYRKRA